MRITGYIASIVVIFGLSGCCISRTAKDERGGDQEFIAFANLRPIELLPLPNGHRAILAQSTDRRASRSTQFVIVDERDNILVSNQNVMWYPLHDEAAGGIALMNFMSDESFPSVVVLTERFSGINHFDPVIGVSVAVWNSFLPAERGEWAMFEHVFEIKMAGHWAGSDGVFWFRIPKAAPGTLPDRIELMFTQSSRSGERVVAVDYHYATLTYDATEAKLVVKYHEIAE